MNGPVIVRNLGSMSMSPLGLMIAGPVVDMFSVQLWFLIAGFVVLLVGVGAFFVPIIMQIEDRATNK